MPSPLRLVLFVVFTATAMAQSPGIGQTPPVVRDTVYADSLYASNVDLDSLGVWVYRVLGVEGDAEFWIDVQDAYGGRTLTPLFYHHVINEKGRDLQEGRAPRVNLNLPRPLFRALLGAFAVVVCLLVALPLYVYRRRYLAELAKRRRLQEVKNQLAESREDERLRLARELHDGPLQDLHALHMQLGVATEALAHGGLPVDTPLGEASQRVRGAQDDAHTIVHDLRRITEALRPPALGPFGLAAALSAYVDRFRLRHPGIKVLLELDADGLDLPEPKRLALFRIAQEAMNNAVKHGSPTWIRVALELSDDEVCLTLEDDGPGLGERPDLAALAADGHFGLLGMQERADAVSGSLDVINRPAGGLRVSVAVPRLDLQPPRRRWLWRRP